jgi:hypothetical protein
MLGKARAILANREGSATASWVFGGVLLVILVAILFLIPEPKGPQMGIIRFFMALAAGFLAYFFVGGVVLKGSVVGNKIAATGGFVFFVLIMFVVNPFNVETVVADVSPSILPTDEAIAQAQQKLAKDGFYAGPITGKADSRTREAVREYQKSKNLTTVDGYLDDATRTSLGVEALKQPTPERTQR